MAFGDAGENRPVNDAPTSLGDATSACARIFPSCAEYGKWGKRHLSSKKGRGRAAKLKDDRDAIVDKLERSGVLVVGIWETLARAKTFALEEFKSSSNFLGVVEDVASKYFSEGFDFCKRQLRRHHPNLAIDLEGMGLDHDLLAEEDEAVEEEKEKEEENEEDGGKDMGDANPLPP
ncbi:hypothetical protein Acr_20g0010040 [Actinidia rufa]|uniref:Uncharacterized protein n=1 Tax=Actinidia rufa TaxID=165716 RepID=A0A7J0GEF7_9ERIC|nr:hypothetical protein Acr_20g0010040 [Actinidia rufa]